MRVALDVFSLDKKVEKSKQRVLAHIEEASTQGAELVVFPEMCVTGLANIGDVERDKEYALHRNDAFLQDVVRGAAKHQVHVALGFLEVDARAMYDSYLLATPQNPDPSFYRRMSSGWRTRASDPEIYRLGQNPLYFPTRHGILTVLVCGDLFDDESVKMVKRSGRFDYVINPLVRHEPDSGERLTSKDWQRELQDYGRRFADLRSCSMMVNLYGEDVNGYFAFGGACVFDGDGDIVAQRPPYEPGFLYAEI